MEQVILINRLRAAYEAVSPDYPKTMAAFESALNAVRTLNGIVIEGEGGDPRRVSVKSGDQVLCDPAFHFPDGE
ncbi:MAG: hypothetical protein AAF720_00920 [Pseudomonadota bacterium]